MEAASLRFAPCSKQRPLLTRSIGEASEVETRAGPTSEADTGTLDPPEPG